MCVLSRGEHWPRSVDRGTGVHPLKAGGGWGEGSPGTNPQQELRNDCVWDRGIRSLRGKGGEENFCFVAHRQTHAGTPAKTWELTGPGQGLTMGFFPKDILKKLLQGLAVPVGLSP